MNLALQKRHEQLERWRQNEAANENQEHSVNRHSANSVSPSDKLNYESSVLTRRQATSNNNTTDNILQQRSKRRAKKLGRSECELQVKFSDSTLFLTACANLDIIECERLLKDNRVDIDVTTCDGLTGLHEAAICGNAQMVEFLIKNGANINCCDNEGWTPLHAAASLGQVKIVQMLLDYGADVTIVNCDNLLAYDLARNSQVQELIGEHLGGADIDFIRSQEERAIQKDIERWIKTGHYDERSHPITNATVLHVIAAKGHIHLLKQILESPILKKQINLEAKDSEGFTPLLAASFWSQTEIVELLIEHGANIFAQSNSGYKISSIHLKNYQQSKLQQPSPTLKSRLSVQSLDSQDSDTSKTTLDLSSTDLSYGDGPENIASGSAPRHHKPGHILKSRSLDTNQPVSSDPASVLPSSRSVDRLLMSCETLSERELRKSYKELVIENEDLRKQMKHIDDREKQKQQEWIRKERQLQRKISELEEENRQLEQWKQEIQHLKDENSSLIRVVTKLSKKH